MCRLFIGAECVVGAAAYGDHQGMCYAASGLSFNVWQVRDRTADAHVGEVMSELLALAGINVTVTVAFAAFIWRNQVQAERRNDAAHADLSRRIDGLTAEVAGIGQRLARLEGWIERDRVGQEQS